MAWQFFPEVDGRMVPEFMDKLIALRTNLNFGLFVTSSWRSPELNDRVGGSKGSAHLQGRAVDIAISGEKAFQLVAEAIKYDFTGIGIKQHGNWKRRFIHLDDLDGPIRPRIWTYK